VAIAPDGRTALSGSGDKTVKLWELSSGREIRTFQGHTSSVYSVAISLDGHTALSGSHGDNGTLKLWDLLSGRDIRTFPGWARALVGGGGWRPLLGREAFIGETK
jgi:WD40 repeat protein